MVYFDTSFLVPLILPEATSNKIEQFLTRLQPGELAISHWVRIEFSSALARDVRMGRLDARSAGDAGARFDMLMSESFEVLLPHAADYDLASDYLRRHDTALRAGDALHLAIAHNHAAAAIYSLDKVLLKAGKQLGLPVETGIPSSG